MFYKLSSGFYGLWGGEKVPLILPLSWKPHIYTTRAPGKARQVLVAAQAPGGQSPQRPGRIPGPVGSSFATAGLLDRDDPSASHRRGQKRYLVRGSDVGREEDKLRVGGSWVRRPP